ncbi:hypothetical protein BHE74_00045094 [Ensete ventricosum]|nr:hypothetical protein GW17_00055200 [Ensete ventricosum]RWW48798.1 hypothetical protein BHE74_00045094 [Ensete ventricosum]
MGVAPLRASCGRCPCGLAAGKSRPLRADREQALPLRLGRGQPLLLVALATYDRPCRGLAMAGCPIEGLIVAGRPCRGLGYGWLPLSSLRSL